MKMTKNTTTVVNYRWLITKKLAVVNYHWVFGHFHMFLENNGCQKSNTHVGVAQVKPLLHLKNIAIS